jgi:flagellar hook-associated protein 2
MASTVSASTMSVSGLASGIDTKALIDQLLYLDRSPARVAEANRTIAQNKLDAVKTMNTRLLAVSTALDDVKLGSGFTDRTTTSSNESVVKATATSAAVPGSIKVSVKSLAAAHQVASFGQSSATDELAPGSLVLRLASTAVDAADIVITPETNTLTGMAEAINAANQGIVASVVNDGSGTPYRLLISSAKSGEANAITTLTGTGGFADIIPDLSLVEEVTAPANASVRIGNSETGMLLTSDSNTMDQAIPGLSLQLRTIADNIDVTVAQDSNAVSGFVQTLATSFNSALDYYNGNSKFDTASNSSGPLFGDYDIRRKLGDLEQQFLKTYSDQPAGFQRLSDIGITVGADSKLSVDSAILNEKLLENPHAVQGLLQTAGHAAFAQVDSLTRSGDGAMALKLDTIQSRIDILTSSITRTDTRLEQRKAFYQAKFLSMEKITAQMQSQGNSLSSFISGLSKSSN